MSNDMERERFDLLPCPFCGAGTTEVHENGRVWQGSKFGEPCSVSVRHWCADVPGQPSRMIERVGRDRESALEAWNRRATPIEPPKGWKLVPVEPTDHMSQIGRRNMPKEWARKEHGAVTDEDAADVYRAMLAAAPSAPGDQQGGRT